MGHIRDPAHIIVVTGEEWRAKGWHGKGWHGEQKTKGEHMAKKTTVAIEESVTRETHYLHELEAVAQEHGNVLRPEDVIEYARDPNTALHARFSWDNSHAAHQWRLHQARNLIRVSIKHIGREIQTPIRAFVSLKSDRTAEGGGYRSTVQVMSDSDRRDEMLRDALADLVAIRRKYSHLQELAQIFAAVDQLLNREAA